MEVKTHRLLKILTCVITLLVFAVLTFAFFTFSENKFVDRENNFDKILLVNASVPEKSSSFYVFSRRSTPLSYESSISSEESSAASEGESESRSESRAESSSEKPHKSSSSSRPSHSSSHSSAASVPSDRIVPIMGKAVLTKQQLLDYSKPQKDKMRLTCSLDQLIDYYFSVGEEYGVRGDIAYLQAVNETGWFKFRRPNSYLKFVDGKWVRIYEPRPEGLYAKPEDNNFCGLGITGKLGDEKSLCRFSNAKLGVTAHIQHLYSYACTAPLPAGKEKVDPRFTYVRRGCAPNWNDLGNGNWASSPTYADKILKPYFKVLNEY